LSAVAERYAAALAEVALERKLADKVRSDLGAFMEMFLSSADLRNALESPVVSSDVKHKVIHEVAAKMGVDAAVQNFLYLIVDHRRTEMLHEIPAALQQQLNIRMGIAEAEVSSARELSGAEKQQLTAMLERRTGKKIEASFRQDKALLGGAVVRVGSTIYDGSVREQLNRLRERLETE
jgi:F-type H+-transporting ATPase subunit delta